MLTEIKELKEYHKNGTLFIRELRGYFEPIFFNIYGNIGTYRTDNIGNHYIKLLYEKHYDNGQFAWKLEWDDKGNGINKMNQYKPDGSIIIY